MPIAQGLLDTILSGKVANFEGKEILSDDLIALIRNENLHPRGIRITNALFPEEVDLTCFKIEVPLEFTNCTFKAPVLLVDTRLRSLNLSRSTFQSTVDGTDLECEGNISANVTQFQNGLVLESAVICGGLILTGAHLGSNYRDYSLRASSCQIDGNLRMDSDTNRFQSDGPCYLFGANIGGVWSCDGALFLGDLFAQNSMTKSDIYMRFRESSDSKRFRFEAKGVVNLNGSQIGGKWECDGALFEGEIKAQHLKTGSDVFMRAGTLNFNSQFRFEAKAMVNMQAAIVGGTWDCEGALFEGVLIAQGIVTKSHVQMRAGMLDKNKEHRFEAKSPVNLLGANIGGSWDCEGALFEQELIAQSILVHSHVLMPHPPKSLRGPPEAEAFAP